MSSDEPTETNSSLEIKPIWVPIESNPDLMTEYTRCLGATKGTWHDIFSFDEADLDQIPKPVVAVIFLYKPNKDYLTLLENEDKKIMAENSQIVDESVYFMKQTIGGACGTIALIHSLANCAPEVIPLQVETPLKVLLDESVGLATPELRGKALEKYKEIEEIHKNIAGRGQTEAPERGQRVGQHFSALVHKNGHLYELNGGRPIPINHGVSNGESFLQDAIKVCQQRVQCLMETGEYRFSVIALSAGL